jgi:hypothetical protein
MIRDFTGRLSVGEYAAIPIALGIENVGHQTIAAGLVKI